MPRDNVHLVLMTLKTVELFISFAHVKYFYLRVFTSCQKPITINRVPANLCHNIIMCRQRMYSFATGPWVPQLNVRVFASRKHETLLRVPITGFNITPVVREAELLFACREVENFGWDVVRAGQKFKTWVRERKITNDIRMCLKLIFLSKFYVRINNKAFFVAWNHEFVVVS